MLMVQLATNRLWLCDCAAGPFGEPLQLPQAKLRSFFVSIVETWPAGERV